MVLFELFARRFLHAMMPGITEATFHGTNLIFEDGNSRPMQPDSVSPDGTAHTFILDARTPRRAVNVRSDLYGNLPYAGKTDEIAVIDQGDQAEVYPYGGRWQIANGLGPNRVLDKPGQSAIFAGHPGGRGHAKVTYLGPDNPSQP